MTRSMARELAMHLSFSLGFSAKSSAELLEEQLTPESFSAWEEEDEVYGEFPDEKQREYIENLVRGVGDHGPELDTYISRYAVGWKFERIPRTAAAIMRVAMYEILYMPEIPNKAAINEAVEIAKKYEEPKTVAFINGILGSFLRAEFPETAESREEAEEPALSGALPEEADLGVASPEAAGVQEAALQESPE